MDKIPIEDIRILFIASGDDAAFRKGKEEFEKYRISLSRIDNWAEIFHTHKGPNLAAKKEEALKDIANQPFKSVILYNPVLASDETRAAALDLTRECLSKGIFVAVIDQLPQDVISVAPLADAFEEAGACCWFDPTKDQIGTIVQTIYDRCREHPHRISAEADTTTTNGAAVKATEQLPPTPL